MNKAQRDIRRKTRVLEHAARIGNVRKTCRYFGVARSGFYVWKKAYETHGDEGLVNQKPCPYNPRLRTPPNIVEKILHPSPPHVSPRPHPHRVVSRALSWHHDFASRGLSHPPAPRPERLPSRGGRRAVHTHRYARQVPGHHVQVDVTFLKLVGKDGRATRRYQYTAIDDATRIRALKVYTRHTLPRPRDQAVSVSTAYDTDRPWP